jgi:hypothetical protein
MCCSSPGDYVSVHIFTHESRLIKYLAAQGHAAGTFTIAPHKTCRFFGEEGCALGNLKPFHCRLYPLALLPDGVLGIDQCCPCAGEYMLQLCIPGSDAGRHMKKMKKEISMLDVREKRTLCDWAQKCCKVISFPDLPAFKIF